MSTHENLLALVETYVAENKKFTEGGVKSSATKARGALAEIAKACKARRLEILDEKAKLESK